MIFLSGIFYGVLVSLPPGPSSFAVMQSAVEGKTWTAYKNVGGFILADLLVLLVSFGVLFQIGLSNESLLLKIAASLFLIVYGIKMFKRELKTEAPASKNFFLTLMNPGIWLANFAVLALAGQLELSDFWKYALGIQMGALIWYSILIWGLRRAQWFGRIFLHQIAPVLLLITGVAVLFR